jgi:hypothetical protein
MGWARLVEKIYLSKAGEAGFRNGRPRKQNLARRQHEQQQQDAEANMLGVNKLAARWMFWMQFLLDSPEWLLLSQGLAIDL